MRESAFLAELQQLLAGDVDGIDGDRKARVLRAAAATLETAGEPVRCTIVPFVPGHRPADEAAHPGLGSSEEVAVILPGARQDPACLLYTVSGDPTGEVSVDATVSFTGPDGGAAPVSVPGWDRRPVPPRAFTVGEDGAASIAGADPRDRGARRVLSLCPAHDLLPGAAWGWDELGAGIGGGATDGAHPFTFGHLFSQRLLVELRAVDRGVPVAAAATTMFVCDLRRSGSLYRRLLDRLVAVDVGRQARAAGVDAPGVAYHPWFPVLRIGAEKADLYTRALVEDIAGSGQHLSDPGWLMRVGLQLEFLTFMGICEAVKDDVGDLLSPAERAAYEGSEHFAEVRARVDPEAWQEVWDLRRIAFPRLGTPRTGPVSALNLLAKKKATLGFLHVHHRDLRHAIALAGRNHHNAQETWQRVFRDAERAVLRMTPAAFPELDYLSEQTREFVLWHRKGRFELGRTVRFPGAVTGLFADQDGLFASACNQYRASMNEVADWAKQHGIMDHTGPECVPRRVSLLEAHLDEPARVAAMQHRDGFGPALDAVGPAPAGYARPADEVGGLLASTPPFCTLAPAERLALAAAARPRTLGPTERLLVQGQRSSRSLFLLAEGELEVLVRDHRGEDVTTGTIRAGALVGGPPAPGDGSYDATVRALEGAVVYELGPRQYEPVLRGGWEREAAA